MIFLIDYDQIISILRNTAIDLGDPAYDYIFGYGRIDALSAISTIIPISVDIENGNHYIFMLQQNYPNPFNPSTTIRFTVPKESFTSLEIFNALGEKISTLVSEILSGGDYRYSWNALKFPSGIYFYKLSSGTFTEIKKMILIK